MIIDLFKKTINNTQDYFYKNNKITVGVKKDKKTILKTNKYWIYIFFENENELDLIDEIENIFNFIIEIFIKKSYPNNKIKIISYWYIFNNIVDEKTFNNIKIKKNKCLSNKYVLINKNTGETIFNPGERVNNVMSERIKWLFNEYENKKPLDDENEKLFFTEISHLVYVLEVILNSIK